MDCVCKSCRAVFEFNEIISHDGDSHCPQCGADGDEIIDAEEFDDQDDLGY